VKSLTPIPIPIPISPTSALFSNGGIICYGANHYGQLGINSIAAMGGAGTLTILTFISFSDTLPAIMVIYQLIVLQHCSSHNSLKK
jgi:hypothetical protein